MDDKINKDLREIQATMIRSTKKNMSFSRLVNTVLKCGLREAPRKWRKM